MCLQATKEQTEKLKKRMSKKHGRVIFYKAVCLSENKRHLASPFEDAKIKAGWYKSDRVKEELDFDKKRDPCASNFSGPNHDYYCFFADIVLEIQIKHGIHVYLNKKDAEREISGGFADVVIEVRAFVKDFVGAGEFDYQGSAVFYKVLISKKAYDKALKEAKARYKDRKRERK